MRNRLESSDEVIEEERFIKLQKLRAQLALGLQLDC